MEVVNNVLLLKIEGPVWYTIYHHLLVVKGNSNPSIFINQPMGIWDIYGSGRPIVQPWVSILHGRLG